MIFGKDIVNAAPKYMGTPYSTMDCQAFVERCLKDAGLKKDLAGSNTWYRFLMEHGWVGTPEECKKKFGKIPVGAFLFILEFNGKEPAQFKGDGIGNASHIGLYTWMTGDEMVKLSGVSGASRYNYGDGAMHSSSSRGCVCTSKFSGKSISGGWNRIGLWSEVSYGIDLSPEENGGDVPLKVTYQAIVIGGALNMRSAPSTSAARITQIPEGATVTVTEEDGDWCKATYMGNTGYVMGQYLEEVRSDNTEYISVPRAEVEKIYDMMGDWLGKRG